MSTVPSNKIGTLGGTKSEKVSKPTHRVPFQSGRELVTNTAKSLFFKVMDEATDVLIASNNFINSNTNIPLVDKYTAAFVNFMNSVGGVNFNNYYFFFNNWWALFDAMAMYIRAIEERNIGRFEDKREAAKKEAANVVIAETVETLNDANTQLIAFKDNLAAWICRNAPNIARNGVIPLRRRANQREDRQIDCFSLLERVDEHWDEEDDGDEEEDLEEEHLKESKYSSTIVGGVSHDNKPSGLNYPIAALIGNNHSKKQNELNINSPTRKFNMKKM